MKETFGKFIIRHLWITFGSILYAIGFNWCYVPNTISFGGLTGIAQMLNYFYPAIPVGVMVIVFNIPLFLLGWKLLGGKVLASSLYAMAATNVFIDGITAIFGKFEPMDPLLSSLYGGVIVGIGRGIIFQNNSSTGGSDLGARLLKVKLPWLPVSRALVALDLTIIIGTGFIMGTAGSTL